MQNGQDLLVTAEAILAATPDTRMGQGFHIRAIILGCLSIVVAVLSLSWLYLYSRAQRESGRRLWIFQLRKGRCGCRHIVANHQVLFVITTLLGMIPFGYARIVEVAILHHQNSWKGVTFAVNTEWIFVLTQAYYFALSRAISTRDVQTHLLKGAYHPGRTRTVICMSSIVAFVVAGLTLSSFEDRTLATAATAAIKGRGILEQSISALKAGNLDTGSNLFQQAIGILMQAKVSSKAGHGFYLAELSLFISMAGIVMLLNGYALLLVRRLRSQVGLRVRAPIPSRSASLGLSRSSSSGVKKIALYDPTLHRLVRDLSLAVPMTIVMATGLIVLSVLGSRSKSHVASNLEIELTIHGLPWMYMICQIFVLSIYNNNVWQEWKVTKAMKADAANRSSGVILSKPSAEKEELAPVAVEVEFAPEDVVEEGMGYEVTIGKEVEASAEAKAQYENSQTVVV